MRWFVLGILKIYKRFISPNIMEACRFTPTCSEYMMTAVTRYGAIKGIWMGLRRIMRCHPWHPGGHDPVP